MINPESFLAWVLTNKGQGWEADIRAILDEYMNVKENQLSGLNGILCNRIKDAVAMHDNRSYTDSEFLNLVATLALLVEQPDLGARDINTAQITDKF